MIMCLMGQAAPSRGSIDGGFGLVTLTGITMVINERRFGMWLSPNHPLEFGWT